MEFDCVNETRVEFGRVRFRVRLTNAAENGWKRSNSLM